MKLFCPNTLNKIIPHPRPDVKYIGSKESKVGFWRDFEDINCLLSVVFYNS